MTRLIDFALANRFLVLLGSLLLAAAGFWAMTKLPIDAVPDVTNVQVQVMTTAPALSPLEVEQSITVPVETSMSGLPRVEEIRSVSQFGLSVVTIVFEEGTDIFWRGKWSASGCSKPGRRSRPACRARKWARSPPVSARFTSSRFGPNPASNIR